MPEIAEATSQTFILACFVAKIASGTVGSVAALKIRNIWADPSSDDISKAEESATRDNCRIRAGMVHRLHSNTGFMRGGRSKESRDLIYPPKDVIDAAGGSVTGIELLGISGNPRNVTLVFNCCYLQIQLYTHTLPLIYTLDDFYHVLARSPRQFRSSKIGIALEIEDYVIAFTTLDLLIGIHWSVRSEDLPSMHIDIYDTPRVFLMCLMAWVEDRRERNGEGMAYRKRAIVTLIREECHVFAGIGVYTVCEVMHRAGLSLLMTEEELFRSASRMMRLFAAMYCWAKTCHEEIPVFTRTTVKNWKVAPTAQQKKRWYQFLCVFGKDKTEMSSRKRVLLRNFQSAKLQQGNIKSLVEKDVFEPTDVKHAFEDLDGLGDLVFGGKKWASFGDERPRTNSKSKQELSEMATYMKHKVIPYFKGRAYAMKDSSDSLNLDAYDTLFVSATEAGTARATTLMLRIDGKQGWTIIPPFNFQIRHAPDGSFNKDRSNVLICSDHTRSKHLHTARTDDSLLYHVGPVSFSGMSLSMKRSGRQKHSKELILIDRIDHRGGESYQRRALAPLFRCGRKVTRSGYTFKSVDEVRASLFDFQATALGTDADALLSDIMEERGILHDMNSVKDEHLDRLPSVSKVVVNEESNDDDVGEDSEDENEDKDVEEELAVLEAALHRPIPIAKSGVKKVIAANMKSFYRKTPRPPVTPLRILQDDGKLPKYVERMGKAASFKRHRSVSTVDIYPYVSGELSAMDSGMGDVDGVSRPHVIKRRKSADEVVIGEAMAWQTQKVHSVPAVDTYMHICRPRKKGRFEAKVCKQ